MNPALHPEIFDPEGIPWEWIGELMDNEEWGHDRRAAEFFRFGQLASVDLKTHPLFKYFDMMRDEVTEARYYYITRFLGWKE